MSQAEKYIKHLLGRKVEDRVTGIKGVVTSISFDLYGCVQALVTPYAKEDGSLGESWWFDVTRLIIKSKRLVMDIPDYNAGYIAEGKSGCAYKPTK